MRRNGSKGRRTYGRSCHGKRRYKDHGEAVAALQRLGNTSQRSKVPVRAYACGSCNGYHLTSQP